MSNYLQKIIYLSEEQYQDAISNNTINENYLYITDNNVSLLDLGDTIIDVAHGGTGLETTTYVNAILAGNSSSATGNLSKIRTASGALYATAQDGAAIFGTLPIAQGGTGATSASDARTSLGLGSFATKSSLAWNEITQTGANGLTNGSSEVTASTEILTSYASNNGFSDNSGKGIVYRRAASKVVNATLVKAALGTVGTTAKKFLKDTGSWVQVDWGDITNIPTTITPSSHTHGNIQNSGILQTSDITIASGDKLIVTDNSDSDKIARTSIAFDGSTTTKALTQKGTWESFTNNAGTITGITMNGASKGTSGVVDLGTVITSHQDISGKLDKPSTAGTSGQVLTSDGNGSQSWQNASSSLPAVTSSDNGKFLRVVNGIWTVDTVPSANGVGF